MNRLQSAMTLVVALGAAVAAIAADPPQSGEVVSQSQIEAALAKPVDQSPDKPRTRGLTIRATTEGRDAQQTPASAPPAVNLTIPFEYNSAELRPESVRQLAQLESALKADALAHYRFLVAGHTDASGNAAYNRELSQRRAEAVRRFLIAGGVSGDRLDAVGQGEDRLLLPEQPDDARNRRVEIRNLGEAP
ncbi:MAG: OmpA family protein [Pseudomonadota bacterium]